MSFPDENHVSILNYLTIALMKRNLIDEKQWVLKPENSLVWHKEVLGWINKYSGVAEEQEELRRSVAGLII